MVAKGYKQTAEHRAKIRARRLRPGARTVGMASNWRHGLSRSPTYNSFRAMHARCGPNGKYAKFGTMICAEWAFFDNFLADMGIRPVGTTLDRIDPYGHYEPANCRWATPEQQAANTRLRAAIQQRQSTPSAGQDSVSINPLAETGER